MCQSQVLCLHHLYLYLSPDSLANLQVSFIWHEVVHLILEVSLVIFDTVTGLSELEFPPEKLVSTTRIYLSDSPVILIFFLTC